MLRDRNVLGEPAVASVADAFPYAAAVLASRLAAVAVSAGVGEQRYHAVALADEAHIIADFFHHTGDFVPQHHARTHAATQRTAHHQLVVVTEAAGRDPHQRLVRTGQWNGQIGHRQVGRRSRAFQ